MTGESRHPDFVVFVRTWIGLDQDFAVEKFDRAHDTEMWDELEKLGWAQESQGQLYGWGRESAFVSEQRFLLGECTEIEARLVAKHLNAKRESPEGEGVLRHGWLHSDDLETGEGIVAYEQALESTAECERSRKSLDLVRKREAERQKEAKPARPKRRRARARDGWIYLNDAEERYGVARSTLQDWHTQLPAGSRDKDTDSNQVYVEESALRELLKRKGRLPR